MNEELRHQIPKITKQIKEDSQFFRFGLAAYRFLNNAKVPLFVCFFDLKTGQFLKVNKGVEIVLGYKPEEMEGHSFHDFVHPDDLKKGDEERKRNHQNIIVDEDPSHENRYKHKNGGWVNLTWYYDNSSDDFCYCIAFKTI